MSRHTSRLSIVAPLRRSVGIETQEEELNPELEEKVNGEYTFSCANLALRVVVNVLRGSKLGRKGDP